MPGKHAPSSPWSFYLSLARAASGVVAVVLLVVVLAVVAFGGRGTPKKDLAKEPATSPTPSASTLPSESPSPSPSPTIRAPGQVEVKVLNGNGRTGLASKIGDEMKGKGWNVVVTTNAGKPQDVSVIYYRPGLEAEALALQKQFPSFTQVKPAGEAPSEIKVDRMLVAVLGKDWPR